MKVEVGKREEGGGGDGKREKERMKKREGRGGRERMSEGKRKERSRNPAWCSRSKPIRHLSAVEEEIPNV